MKMSIFAPIRYRQNRWDMKQFKEKTICRIPKGSVYLTRFNELK